MENDRIDAGMTHEQEAEAAAWAEAGKPRQAATNDRMNELRGRAGRQNLNEETRSAARRELTETVDGDLQAYLDGSLDGVVTGPALGAAVWRTDATRTLGFLAGVLHLRSNRQPIDASLLQYFALACDVQSGEAARSVETIAALYGRSPATVYEAITRIRPTGQFAIEHSNGATIVWRLRGFPAAKALGLPNYERVLGRVERAAAPKPRHQVRSGAGPFASSNSAVDANRPEFFGGVPVANRPEFSGGFCRTVRRTPER